MGEVLSQSEIDNLLAALSSGELDTDELNGADEKQVKDYDFKRPTKFSKEHLRTLEIIYEHYGRLLSTSMQVHLRKTVQVSVTSSETVIFSEFSNSLSNPVILGIVNFQPLGGTILIELASQLGFAMILRGVSKASSPLTSGTTRGTSASMRKALLLSIMMAPPLVMVSANSRLVPAPAEVKAISTSLKSSGL